MHTGIYRDVHLPFSRRITMADGSSITTQMILLRNHELLSESSAERKAG